MLLCVFFFIASPAPIAWRASGFIASRATIVIPLRGTILTASFVYNSNFSRLLLHSDVSSFSSLAEFVNMTQLPWSMRKEQS